MAIDFEKVNKLMKLNVPKRDDWVKKCDPEGAFKYYEGSQKPEGLDTGSNYWVMLNLVRKRHQSNMAGIINTNPVIEVRGVTADSLDKKRVRLWKELIEAVCEEMKIRKFINDQISSTRLAGMGALQIRYDKNRNTKLFTGIPVVEKRDIMSIYLDHIGRDTNGMDGRSLAYLQWQTRESFEDKWNSQIEEKKIDIDALFDKAKSNKVYYWGTLTPPESSEDDNTLPILQWEYWIPKDGAREYRVAIFAGDEQLVDYVSDLSAIRCWNIILMMQDVLHNSPYPSLDFTSDKHTQDLQNVILSLLVNSQVRNMNAFWSVLKGTVDPTEWAEQARKAGGVAEYEFTKNMIEMGLTINDARPKREAPGEIDPGLLQIFQIVANMDEKVTMPNVMLGINESNVTSGKQSAILSAQGAKPNIYHRNFYDEPLERLGQGIYELIRKYKVEEFEIPVSNEAGVKEGVKVNRILSQDEIVKLSEELITKGDKTFEEEARMISVRDGEKRIALIDFIKEKRIDMSGPERLTNLTTAMGEKVQIVENDITFGNFAVKIVMDPDKEQTKAVQISKNQVLAQYASQMGAPRTAFDMLLEAMEYPNRDEIISKVMDENKQMAIGKMAVEGIQKLQQGEINAQQFIMALMQTLGGGESQNNMGG